MFTTSKIWLAFLRVLWILYISTDQESFWVFMQCFSIKLQLMEVHIALEFSELTSTSTAKNSVMLVVFKMICKYSNILEHW